MRQIRIFQGYRADETEQMANDWLADVRHQYPSIQIQYNYHDGFCGVIIIYDEVAPTPSPQQPKPLEEK